MLTVSKMMSHHAGTVQKREDPESWIKKWEDIWFKTTAEDGERGGSSDVWWKTVPQTTRCIRKHCRWQWIDEYIKLSIGSILATVGVNYSTTKGLNDDNNVSGRKFLVLKINMAKSNKCRKFTVLATWQHHLRLTTSRQWKVNNNSDQSLKVMVNVKLKIVYHSYGVPFAIRDNTVLPATRHKWT